MEPVTWGFLGTLAGVIVGAAASIGTTYITTRNSRLLQQDAASLERKEQAREFQRQNLIELQESLFNCMRLTGKAHLEDLESFRKSTNDGRSSLLTEELSQELMMSNRQIAILTERVADQKLRNSIQELRKNMTNVLMAKTEQGSYSELQVASNSFDEIMKNLGSVLRESY